jgi:hypothetical protein
MSRDSRVHEGIPKATAIILTTAERTELECLACSTKSEHRPRQRARIGFGRGGLASRAIGRAVGCTTDTVSKWRVRYAEKRIDGLPRNLRPWLNGWSRLQMRGPAI